MISNVSKIEIKIGERIYQFLCNIDSPIGEVHDALSAMKGIVVQKIQELEKGSQVPENEQEEENKK